MIVDNRFFSGKAGYPTLEIVDAKAVNTFYGGRYLPIAKG
jgi:hypothetical protein